METKQNDEKDAYGNVYAVRLSWTACERVKWGLSSSANASIAVDQQYDRIDFYTSISRAKFEELFIDPFKQTITHLYVSLMTRSVTSVRSTLLLESRRGSSGRPSSE